MFSLVDQTLIDVKDSGNFISWQEVTAKLVHKHLLPSGHTAKGHLKQQRKNIKSTNKHNNVDDFLDRHSPQENNNNETNNIFITIVTQNELKKSTRTKQENIHSSYCWETTTYL